MIVLQALAAAIMACMFSGLVGFAWTRARKADEAGWRE